jgi:alkanesulfonate monooxygenase SsuD/methylene tetrahydromethanopterin reductase-like flavin-dependent oxidoreductase (luciferase family)
VSPKTRLGGLVVADTVERAEQRGREMARARGMDEERYRGYVIAGDPDAVCEQVAAYFDAGLDGLVFNMHDAQDLEPVRLAGRTLSAAFG